MSIRRRSRTRPRAIDQSPVEAISRQPVVVHGVADIRKGRSSRVLEDGRVVHEPVDLFVRPEPRMQPQPEQPRSFYKFEEMVRNLDLELAHILMPGGSFKLNMAGKEAKYQPRFFKGGLLTQLANPKIKGVRFSSKWIAFHPAKIVKEMLNRSVGLLAFRKDKKVFARANMLKRKYSPYAEGLVRRFVSDSVEAVRALYRETMSGQVTLENRNVRFSQYTEKLRVAKLNYKNAIRVLERAYMAESRGKATVTLTNNGVVVQNLGKLGRRSGDPATTDFYPQRGAGRGGTRTIEFDAETGAREAA